MQIQVNTDRHVDGRHSVTEYVRTVVQHAIGHFEPQVTRVEVFLSDENGSKAGADDKRCVLEARIVASKPVVVTHRAGNLDEAIHGAAARLKRSLANENARVHAHR